MEEYNYDDIHASVEDMDTVIHRLEEFRSIFRERYKEVEHLMGIDDFNLMYGGVLDEILLRIKNRLLDIKKLRRGLRNSGHEAKVQADAANLRYFKFVHDEIKNQLADIEGQVAVVAADESDDELLFKSKHIAEIQKKLDDIWRKISEIMKLNVDAEAVDTLQEEYRTLVDLKKDYTVELQAEVSKRELKKKENFKKTKLNIELPKFSGYDCVLDIYTFKSDFEKLHNDTVPKEHHADLLKNNYLKDPALSLVKSVLNIEEIWKRLKKAYGSPKHLMQKKFRELSSIDPGKRGESSKSELWISKIIFIMKDLSQLAAAHGIEGMLYNGDGIDKVLKLLGESRVTRWLAKDCYHDEEGSDSDEDDDTAFERKNKESWKSLIVFLEKELRITQRKSLVFQNIPDDSFKPKQDRDRNRGNSSHVTDDVLLAASDPGIPCSICGKSDHLQTTGPNHTKVVQYYSCPDFVQMSPSERFKLLRRKELCFQCLLPGADWNTGKHKEGTCQWQYACKHDAHTRHKRKKHVLVCGEHKMSPENIELLQKYKERCFPRDIDIPQFSRDIGIALHVHADDEVHVVNDTVQSAEYANSEIHRFEVVEQGSTIDDQQIAEVHQTENLDNLEDIDVDIDVEEEIRHKAIYQFQIIEQNNQRFLCFYDNGCGNFVIKYNAVQKLRKFAILNHPPPLLIKGVGGIVAESPYGEYKITLKKADGKWIRVAGACLEKIADTFPQYPLHGAVEDDIRSAFKASGGKLKDLPKLPKYIGGDVDFMFGSKLLRYHPKPVFELPSGLTIFESVFQNADGGRGVVGGPHEVFEMMAHRNNTQKNPVHLTAFLCNQVKHFTDGYAVNPDLGLLGFKDSAVALETNDVYLCGHSDSNIRRSSKAFECVEGVGSTITYRCPKHRQCKECREGDHREELSLREEIEDNILDNCVKLDVVTQKCSFKMPVIMDPVIHLSPNADTALKMYKRVLNQLKDETSKQEVLAAESKLQRLGKVEYVRNLPVETQEMLKSHPIQNFIPWNIAYKDTSVSTPCRPVWNASFPTRSGKSLNDILVKGSNSLNKMQEIFIRWSVHAVGFHTDVQTMYPSVDLREEDWCFQRYWWHERLAMDEPPEEKIITKCIYGVKPSGNIAEKAIRLTAEHSRKEFPDVYDVIRHDTYMDDIISGCPSVEEVHKLADDMDIVLGRGGFILKGWTITGSPPLEKLSNDDGKTIFAGGMIQSMTNCPSMSKS